ncbi:MAG TPA: hypothetical protein VGI44_00570 [Acidimicrobiales bacterium]|jgi:hypothetical protein
MFAGILFTLVGIFNFIDGIVAISNAHYLNSHLVFGDLKSWGWTMLILGIIIFLVGLGIIAGQAWAVFAGIVLAVFDAIGQLLFLPSYPVWSIIMIAVDVFVIYGLAMYGVVPTSARS